MEPLKIECQIGGAWLPPAFGLHLDGLIAWSLMEQSVVATSRALAAGAAVTPTDYAKVLKDLKDVFEKDPVSGMWCASMFAPVGWSGHERRMIVGKTNEEEMSIFSHEGFLEAAGGNKVDTARGIAKNSQVFFSVEHVRGLRAWCIGEPELLEELLFNVEAVGVKTRIGLGNLMPYEDGALWRVTSCPEAAERWKYRSSPVRLIPDSYPAIGSCEAPYWRNSRTNIFRPYPIREAA